jgi:FHA domain
MSAIILLTLRIVLIAVLYLFIGWAFLTLWRDLRLQNTLLSRPRFPAISLTRIENGIPQSVRFTSPRVTIGRDPAAEFFLEEKTISARHARLYFENTQWWAEDLDSMNGTFLNQERVVEPVALAAGDQLQCGQVVFTIAIGDRAGEQTEYRL